MTFFVCQQSKAEQIIDFSELSCIKEHGEHICLGKDLKPYTGIVHRRYSDGTLRAIINYKDGKEDGLKKEYYSSNRIAQEYTAKNGEKQGISIAYNLDGTIIRKCFYEQGIQQWCKTKEELEKDR